VKDAIFAGLVVVAFAIVVTAHVAIAFGLVRRTPRWRAPLAFAVVPLAPYFAWREQMRVRAVVWIAGALLYVIGLILASLR
jgi:hypothetical protein